MSKYQIIKINPWNLDLSYDTIKLKRANYSDMKNKLEESKHLFQRIIHLSENIT